MICFALNGLVKILIKLVDLILFQLVRHSYKINCLRTYCRGKNILVFTNT